MHSRMPGMFLAAGFLALGACADTGETAVDDFFPLPIAAGGEGAGESAGG